MLLVQSPDFIVACSASVV